MKVAIILGFSYLTCPLGPDDFDYKLPGIILDLYTAYQYALRIACDKILVVTDQIDYPIDHSLLSLMLNGAVAPAITTLFSTLKGKGQLLEFINMDNLLHNLIQLARGATRLIFYYSGHAHHGMTLIPKYRHQASYDDSHKSTGLHVVAFTEFLRPIVAETDNHCSVLCIMDCCNSRGLTLPYQLVITDDSGRELILKHDWDSPRPQVGDFFFRLGNLESLNVWFGSREVITICLSSISVSSHFGSRFTLKIFQHLLSSQLVSYPQLLAQLNTDLIDIKELLVELRSSYPNRYFIQPWIREPGLAIIEYDKQRQVFTFS